MPPPFRVPPRAGAAVGLLTAVILGLLIGGVAGVALHERSEDDDTVAPTTTTGGADATSSTTAATTTSSTATPGATGSGPTAPASSVTTASTTTTSSTTTSSTGTATSPTTTARGGAEPTLAHTGAPADLLLLLGLAAGGLGLATRRTRTCARRG